MVPMVIVVVAADVAVVTMMWWMILFLHWRRMRTIMLQAVILVHHLVFVVFVITCELILHYITAMLAEQQSPIPILPPQQDTRLLRPVF